MLDEVHLQMYRGGYDKAKLNKAFLVFNLTSLLDEKAGFNGVADALMRMNEQVENYEICNYLKEIKEEINGK